MKKMKKSIEKVLKYWY